MTPKTNMENEILPFYFFGNLDEPQGLYVKSNKPDIEQQIFNVPTHMWKIKKFIS
jgi:hypothetical protein